jgi:hypothetical protein
VLPGGTVTEALRMPFAHPPRRRSGWANGSQPLKSPTTETAPVGSAAGSVKVTRTMPSRPSFVVLIIWPLR